MHLALAIIATIGAVAWFLFICFAAGMDPEGRPMDSQSWHLALWPFAVPALLWAAWYWNWWAY